MKDILAFPHSFVRHPTEETYITKGMTLRDYFAAQAMESMLNNSTHYESVAKYAYRMADAMMKERTDGL